MTTIAYRDGVLAGDTRVTLDGSVVDDATKVFRLKSGALLGCAGIMESSAILRHALEQEGDDLPSLKGVTALVIEKNGKIWCYEGAALVRLKGRYYAIGTGQVAALAAMDAGANAVQAVKIGIKRDTNSGGRVKSVSLAPKKQRKDEKNIPKTRNA